MKLRNLKLQNFKGITNFDLPLDGKCTIIFGINGVGKSTILRSIDLLYANIIARLMGTKKLLAELQEDDISYGKSKARIAAEFELSDGKQYDYYRLISRTEGRKHNKQKLLELVDAFENLYITKGYEDKNGCWIEEDDKKNMPIFVNYGVHRLVLEVPVKVTDKNSFNKLSAFDKAIESKIDFKRLFEWFRIQEDIENQEKVRLSANYQDRSLQAVKKAMLAMLDGFEDIHIERNPLAMKVKKDGKYLNINQLSDGEKCTIALFGDLARRMALANPNSVNPLDGEGVVLIDELDLHMHTSWQRKVVGVLEQTFPNIQFIITTHSPQILGEINQNHNLFFLKREEGQIVCHKYESFIGWDSNVILEEVMGTSSVNLQVKEQINTMYALIADKKYDEAEKIADYLLDITNGYADGVAKAKVLIARGRRSEKN